MRRACRLRGCLLSLLFLARLASGGLAPGFRPPCVPLNVVSPYQSTWSCSDTLPGSWPQHWNGDVVEMTGLAKIDGTFYTWMGRPAGVERFATQTSVTVAPLTTTYTFKEAGVGLSVKFLSPAFDLDANLSAALRPITDVTLNVWSEDGWPHEVELYYDNSAEGAVSTDNETVWASRPEFIPAGSFDWFMGFDVRAGECVISDFVADENRCVDLCCDEPSCVTGVVEEATGMCWLLSCGAPSQVVAFPSRNVFFRRKFPVPRPNTTIMRIGASSQRELKQNSDRINWGWWYVAARKDSTMHSVIGKAESCRGAFINSSYFDKIDEFILPSPVRPDGRVLSLAWNFGWVTTALERHFTISYDQVLSIMYFGTAMMPLWRMHWHSHYSMLLDYLKDYGDRHDIVKAAATFDSDLIANLTAKGGDKYATIASLAYRQTIAGTQAVYNPVTNESWVFLKEVSSCGCISTVDVIFPAAPIFQWLYPQYLQKMLAPLLAYSLNETQHYGLYVPYNYSWAPHDLGRWPVCDLAPAGQENMPLEESGNFLILVADLVARTSWKLPNSTQDLLRTWADFVVSSLPDPPNQKCTDDFEGPMPSNVNLAAKGIVALSAYSNYLVSLGQTEKAAEYERYAKQAAKWWKSHAEAPDHYTLQFGAQKTWSIKYNLFSHRVFGFDVFEPSIMTTEMGFYISKRGKCGVPLDSRHRYTKTDSMMLAASLGTQEQFEVLTSDVYTFAQTTSTRVPFSDWYDVDTCDAQGSLQSAMFARPVQGSMFAPMLVEFDRQIPETLFL